MDYVNTDKSWHSASLYIGDLAPNVTECDLESIFQVFGDLKSVKVCRDWSTGAPLGYGFVNFCSVSAASMALRLFNHEVIKGRPCRLMWSTKRSFGAKHEGEAANVFVKNLSKTIDHKALHALFSKYGSILSAKVAINRIGTSMGYGYVSFTSSDAAESAIRGLNGHKVNGVRMSVEHFLDRSERNITAVGSKVFVGDLPRDWTEKELKKRFMIYGSVLSADIIQSSKGKSRGFGFVVFDNAYAAVLAVKDNGKVTEFASDDIVHNVALRIEHSTAEEESHNKKRSVSVASSESINTSLFDSSSILDIPDSKFSEIDLLIKELGSYQPLYPEENCFDLSF